MTKLCLAINHYPESPTEVPQCGAIQRASPLSEQSSTSSMPNFLDELAGTCTARVVDCLFRVAATEHPRADVIGMPRNCYDSATVLPVARPMGVMNHVARKG